MTEGMQVAKELHVGIDMPVEDLWNLYYKFGYAVVLSDGKVTDFIYEGR